MTEMLLCQVLTSPPRYRQKGEQRLYIPTVPLGQAYASRWPPMKSHKNRCNGKKIGWRPLYCLSRRCRDQAIGHSRSRDYWRGLRLSDSADGLPPPPAFIKAMHILTCRAFSHITITALLPCRAPARRPCAYNHLWGRRGSWSYPMPPSSQTGLSAARVSMAARRNPGQEYRFSNLREA